jgi:hypothetical protein
MEITEYPMRSQEHIPDSVLLTLPHTCDGCQIAVDAGHNDDMIQLLINGKSGTLRDNAPHVCDCCTTWHDKIGIRKNYIASMPAVKMARVWSKWTNDTPDQV